MSSSQVADRALAAPIAVCYNRRVRRAPRLLLLAILTAGLSLPWIAAPDPAEVRAQERPEGEDAETEAEGTPRRAEEEEPPVLTLADLTRAAERSYPGLRASKARIRAAQAQLDEAWVSPFFQSEVTVGFGLAPVVRGSPIFSPDSQLPLDNPWAPVVTAGIEGVVPIWTFGKLGAARDAARSGIRAAEGDQRRVRAELRRNVRRAYFALQLSLDVQQMLREGMPHLREAVARIEEALEQDDGSDPDITPAARYRITAALAEVEARQAQALQLERTSRAALRTLTGLERFRIPECPIEPILVELEPLATYQRRATDQRPEVRMLQAAVRARQASLDYTQARFWPDLALAYRFSTSYAPGITDQTNPFIIDSANYASIRAGLVARWSLDLWGNAYRVEREESLLADARERSREAVRGMELQVAEAYHAVEAAQSRERSWRRGRRATRSWFISASQGDTVGVSESRELVDAARSYFTARFSHLEAIHDLNVALARLEEASGARVVAQWEPECE